MACSMNPIDPQPRESTSVGALATMLAAAVVLSVGVASGSLGGFAPAAAVNAVLMGGMHTVATSATPHPSVRMNGPRDAASATVAMQVHGTAPAPADRLTVAGPSGPAAANLPPPHVG